MARKRINVLIPFLPSSLRHAFAGPMWTQYLIFSNFRYQGINCVISEFVVFNLIQMLIYITGFQESTGCRVQRVWYIHGWHKHCVQLIVPWEIGKKIKLIPVIDGWGMSCENDLSFMSFGPELIAMDYALINSEFYNQGKISTSYIQLHCVYHALAYVQFTLQSIQF